MVTCNRLFQLRLRVFSQHHQATVHSHLSPFLIELVASPSCLRPLPANFNHRSNNVRQFSSIAARQPDYQSCGTCYEWKILDRISYLVINSGVKLYLTVSLLIQE